VPRRSLAPDGGGWGGGGGGGERLMMSTRGLMICKAPALLRRAPSASFVCAYGLTKQGRPSRPAFGLPGANFDWMSHMGVV
jgi:hypothetical protein